MPRFTAFYVFPSLWELRFFPSPALSLGISLVCVMLKERSSWDLLPLCLAKLATDRFQNVWWALGIMPRLPGSLRSPLGRIHAFHWGWLLGSRLNISAFHISQHFFLSPITQFSEPLLFRRLSEVGDIVVNNTISTSMEWVHVSEVLGNYEKRGRETETERGREQAPLLLLLENPLWNSSSSSIGW